MFMNFVGHRAEMRTAGAKGQGVYATEPIAAGETVVAFGGYVVSRQMLETLPSERTIHSIQIDDDLFMVGPEVPEPGDMVNHSCDPNCGILGSVILVAMRDIAPGEEITFDYAMSDSQDYDEFVCECGTALCREKVTGSDWTRPELQDRYRGWFSEYLERRIGRLVPSGAVRRAFSV
jgi:hypothetical protein